MGAANYQFTIICDQCKERIQLFKKVNGMEEALLEQIEDNFPPIYLHAYTDSK